MCIWFQYPTASEQALPAVILRLPICSFLNEHPAGDQAKGTCGNLLSQHVNHRHSICFSLADGINVLLPWINEGLSPRCPLPCLGAQQTLLQWLIWKIRMWSHRNQPGAVLMPCLRAVLQYPPKFNRVPANCTAVPGSAGRTGLHFCPDKIPLQPCLSSQNFSRFPGKWAGLHCSFPK